MSGRGPGALSGGAAAGDMDGESGGLWWLWAGDLGGGPLPLQQGEFRSWPISSIASLLPPTGRVGEFIPISHFSFEIGALKMLGFRDPSIFSRFGDWEQDGETMPLLSLRCRAAGGGRGLRVSDKKCFRLNTIPV